MLTSVKTQHGIESSYGIKLELLDKITNKTIVIGYTSDTGYFNELPEFFENAEIIIFNISDINEKDVAGTELKKYHLGFYGSNKLISQLKSSNQRLYIASEFCCTNGDVRTLITSSLSEATGVPVYQIIPSDVGLKIYLPNVSVYCSVCRRPNPASEMKTIPPRVEYENLRYICNNCLK